jgi:predicted TIM-barrel fold metal-dependent hydrolase
MRDGFRIMDMDRHVMEPVDMWPEYLPARLRALAPRLVPGISTGESLSERLGRLGQHALLPPPLVMCVGDRPIMRNMPEAAYIEIGLRAQERNAALTAAQTPAGQTAAMDAEGADCAVLLPYTASFLAYDDGVVAEHSRAYAQAYNRWLGEFCAYAPDRLIGAAMISRHDPEAMIPDLEQIVRAGFRAVTVRPNPVLGNTLSSPAYTPFWRACERAEVAVLVHEGTPAHVDTAGADRFDSYFGQHACSHPMEAMMALLSLIEGGVLEAHPGLRVAFLEAGCSWLPHWLWRLDDVEYAALRGEVCARVRHPPSTYFRRQCWIAAEPSEPMLAPVVAEIGSQRVLFGSDYPHTDHDVRALDTLLARRGEIGDQVLQQLLWDNPRRLLGMPLTPD